VALERRILHLVAQPTLSRSPYEALTASLRESENLTSPRECLSTAPYPLHASDRANRGERKSVSVQSAGTRFGAANEPMWSARRRRRSTRRDASRWSRRCWHSRLGWRRRMRSSPRWRSGSRSLSSG
jgi:hypothetical protein